MNEITPVQDPHTIIDIVPTIGEIESSLNSIPASAEHDIDIEVISGRNSRAMGLIASSGDENHAVALNKSGLLIPFREVVAVGTVIAETNEVSKNIKLEVQDPNGKFHKLEPSSSSEGSKVALTFNVDRLAKAIRLYAERTKFFGKDHISGVKIKVLRISDMELALEAKGKQEQIQADLQRRVSLDRAEIDRKNFDFETSKKSSLQELAQKEAERKAQEQQHQLNLKGIQEKTQLATAEKSKAEADYQKSAERLSAVKNEIADKEKALTEVKNEFERNSKVLLEIEGTISTRQKSNAELEEQAISLQTEVKEWVGKKHLFTADLEGVLKEYNFQMKLFFGLSLIPLGISAALAYRLYLGALILNATELHTPAENIWSVLAARAPFATVSGTIIFVLMKFGFLPLIQKVFEIYAIRSKLQEKCFLIKKLTDSVASKVGLNDEQAVKIYIQEKMDHIERFLITKSERNPAQWVQEQLEEKERTKGP